MPESESSMRMGLLMRVGILSALLCAPLWWLLPGGWRWALIPIFVVVLGLVASALSKQFASIYHVRYLEGRPEVALRMLAPWRLLVNEADFVGVQTDALLQAGREAEVERLMKKASLPLWLRHHMRHALARHRKDYATADVALADILTASPPENQRQAALIDRARLLAEFMPDRLDQAHQLLDQAEASKLIPPFVAITRGVRGMVQVAQGDAELGLEALRQACDDLGTTQLLTLPFVAEFHRFMGRAYRQLDRPEQAREEFLTARTLTRLPTLIESAQADLDAL